MAEKPFKSVLDEMRERKGGDPYQNVVQSNVDQHAVKNALESTLKRNAVNTEATRRIASAQRIVRQLARDGKLDHATLRDAIANDGIHYGTEDADSTIAYLVGKAGTLKHSGESWDHRTKRTYEVASR